MSEAVADRKIIERQAKLFTAESLIPFRCPVMHIPQKRLFDIAFSLAVLVMFAPLFLLIALAVRLTSKGPVIYYQKRVGRGGKTFRCYKFRSMFGDADERLERLLASDPELRKEWNETFKLKNDPRITRIGAFIRKTSLDELPQFWNVLRGDLSVVGPRPVVEKEIKEFFGDKAEKILSIRPGLTGIWQTSGRNNTSYARRIRLDERYVDHRSLGLDLKLIAKTIPVMVLSKGAY